MDTSLTHAPTSPLARAMVGWDYLDSHFPDWRARADARAFDVCTDFACPLALAAQLTFVEALAFLPSIVGIEVTLGFSAGEGVLAAELTSAWVALDLAARYGWQVIP